MGPALVLPRLVFGAGGLVASGAELALPGVALHRTTGTLAQHGPDKAARLACAIGLGSGEDLADPSRAPVKPLGLPATPAASGYRTGDKAKLADDMVASHLDRTGPYVPTDEDHRPILTDIAA